MKSVVKSFQHPAAEAADSACHTDRGRHTGALCPADSAGPAQARGTAQTRPANDSAEASANFLASGQKSLAGMPYVGTGLVAVVIAW